MEQRPESASNVRAASPRRPYLTPTLTVFGGIAALTASTDMDGMRDGGPNNSKT